VLSVARTTRRPGATTGAAEAEAALEEEEEEVVVVEEAVVADEVGSTLYFSTSLNLKGLALNIDIASVAKDSYSLKTTISNFFMMFFYFLFLGSLFILVSSGNIVPAIGFVFTSEGWSHPSANYTSSLAIDSLHALAATGANSISVTVSAYVDSTSASVVHGISGPSPLRTAEVDELRPFLTEAKSLNLSIILSCFLDMNWDIPVNFGNHSGDSSNPISRSDIGFKITNENDWDNFFSSWENWLTPFAALATEFSSSTSSTSNCANLVSSSGGVTAFSIGNELDAVWSQEVRMRELIISLKIVYKGCTTAAFTGSSLKDVKWIDALDVIGIDAFWSLGDTPLPLGVSPSIPMLTQNWESATSFMRSISTQYNRSIFITQTGTQSRPNCFLRPWGTGLSSSNDGNDQGDPSAWPCAYDVNCQANVYTSAFEALLPLTVDKPDGFLSGFLFWRWLSDPTAGGPSDSDFTPHGKPSEIVFKNYTKQVLDRRGKKAPLETNKTTIIDDIDDDGSLLIIKSLQRNTAKMIHEGKQTRNNKKTNSSSFTGYRGFVFGGPDEWSSPYYRLDNDGTKQSLLNMKSLGATALQLVVQWYFSNITDTNIYPITDLSNPMPTSTDAEILSFIKEAQSLNIKVVLSPMLDPDWTLPSQNGCRSVSRGRKSIVNQTDSETTLRSQSQSRPGCYWRGQIGTYWPSTRGSCAGISGWSEWHKNYASMMLHYASLAESSGAVDGLLIAHELELPVQNCAVEWTNLLANVRKVFKGEVSVADGGNIFSAPPETLAWLKTLDWMGFECYLGNTAPHPELLWQDATLEDIQKGVEANTKQIMNFVSKLGLKMVCTEGGWMASPWGSETGWGAQQDLADSTVHIIDTWGKAHALAYTAAITVLESFPWFQGWFFWLWRADPTSGGLSDYSPTPWGKESSVAIANLWL
jgi:hypothetical protein